MRFRDVLFEDAPKRLRTAVIIAVLGIGALALLSAVPGWAVGLVVVSPVLLTTMIYAVTWRIERRRLRGEAPTGQSPSRP